MTRDYVGTIDLATRLAAIPRDGLPIERPVTIHWNDHQVPFIQAETDRDLAVALGLVHVHLRWAQLEMMRHVVHGRISELVGPFGLRMDRMLRTIDLPRVVDAIIASMPPDTREWVAGFVDGLNTAVTRLPEVPPEFRLLGLRRTPWSMRDVVALTRLAALDVTWMLWFALLPRLDRRSTASLWRRLLGKDTVVDIADAHDASANVRSLLSALLRFSRPGSNSWAIAASRSATGSVWMANDTHLSPLLPNLWLIAGYQSPGYHATGLMVPGVPAILLGRNPLIAWGGTNLHAASSDLFDISDLPDLALEVRAARVKVRGLGYRTFKVRDSAYGPVISDLPQLKAGKARYALRWMGHSASDEISALLAMNRAPDWEHFRTALNGIGVPGQNILFASADGHIGQAIAAHLPRRPPDPDVSPLLPATARAAWNESVRSTDLPQTLDPPEGFVASANNRTPAAPVLIGYFFSSTQRIERIRALLGARSDWDFAGLAEMQRDVKVPNALVLRDHLVGLLRAGAGAEDLVRPLADWNGRYDADDAAPLILELLLYHLGVALHGKRGLRLYSSVWNTRGLLAQDLRGTSEDHLARAMQRAVPRVRRDLRRLGTWGTMHRLEPRHVLADVPILGRKFRFGDWAADGGSDTVMKTAHGLTSRRHHATLASTARHLSDLADMDANWFVLLGGQDGWIGSTTMLDQTLLWRGGTYIQAPLRPETVSRTHPHRTVLRP